MKRVNCNRYPGIRKLKPPLSQPVKLLHQIQGWMKGSSAVGRCSGANASIVDLQSGPDIRIQPYIHIHNIGMHNARTGNFWQKRKYPRRETRYFFCTCTEHLQYQFSLLFANITNGNVKRFLSSYRLSSHVRLEAFAIQTKLKACVLFWPNILVFQKAANLGKWEASVWIVRVRPGTWGHASTA